MPTNTVVDPQQQNNPFIQNLNLDKYDDLIARTAPSQSQTQNQTVINPIQPLGQQFSQQTTSPIPPMAPTPQGIPDVDPTILAQSLQQFPKGTPTQEYASKGNPENVGNIDPTIEKRAEQILEELKTIENKPEQPQKDEAVKDKNDDEDKPKDHSQAQKTQLGDLKVYGYKIPQKVTKMGKQVDDLKKVGDTASARTWLYALVGRIIAMKLPHEEDKTE